MIYGAAENRTKDKMSALLGATRASTYPYPSLPIHDHSLSGLVNRLESFLYTLNSFFPHFLLPLLPRSSFKFCLSTSYTGNISDKANADKGEDFLKYYYRSYESSFLMKPY